MACLKQTTIHYFRQLSIMALPVAALHTSFTLLWSVGHDDNVHGALVGGTRTSSVTRETKVTVPCLLIE